MDMSSISQIGMQSYDGSPSDYGPQGSYLARQTQGSGFMGGSPFVPLSPLAGIPGMSNPLMQMFLGPQVTSLMGGMGMVPLGIHDRNTYDILKNKRFFAQQSELMQQGAQLDKASWMQTMKGVATLSGTPWGSEQMRMAGGAADMMAAMSPMIQMMAPDLLDQLAGPRGSQAVMANRMALGGRYRLDPISGKIGMSTDTNKRMLSDINESLFTDPMDVASLKGMTAGSYGSLYEEASLRGLMPGSSGAKDTLRQYMRTQEGRNAAAKRTGQQASDFTPEKIGKMGGEEIASLTKAVGEDELRSFDSGRVKSSLQGYISAVNAVKDIFGEMGVSNAPMSQLINALQKLTNNSVGKISNDKLEPMVRMTQQLARDSGIGIDNMLRMQEHAGMRAQALGIESVFGVHAAQGAAAFSMAYRGSEYAGKTAWGRMNIEEMTQADVNLRTNAASSRAMNRVGVTAQLAASMNDFSGLNTPGGKRLREYWEAMKTQQETGATTFGDSKESLNLTQGQWTKMMRDAGIDSSVTGNMLANKEANRGAAEAIGGQNIVRDSQAAEVKGKLSVATSGFLGAQLKNKLSAGDLAKARSRGVTDEITGKIFDLDPAVMTDATERNAAIGDIISSTLKANGVDTSKMTDADMQKLSVGMYNRLDRTSRAKTGMGLQNSSVLFSQQLADTRNNVIQEEKFEADIGSAMAPLNRGTMLQRAVGAIQGAEGKSPDEIWEVVGKTLGGVTREDFEKRLAPVLGEVNDAETKLRTLRENYKGAKTDDERKAIRTQMDEASKTLKNKVAAASTVSAEIGLDDDSGTNLADVTAAQDTQKRATELAATFAEFKKTNNLEDDTPEKAADAYRAFLATNEGQEFRDMSRAAGASADEVSKKLLLSDSDVVGYGLRGQRASSNIDSANAELVKLANKYSGGYVDKLTAGSYAIAMSSEEAAKVQAQVASATKVRDEALADANAMLSGGRGSARSHDAITADAAAISTASGGRISEGTAYIGSMYSSKEGDVLAAYAKTLDPKSKSSQRSKDNAAFAAGRTIIKHSPDDTEGIKALYDKYDAAKALRTTEGNKAAGAIRGEISKALEDTGFMGGKNEKGEWVDSDRVRAVKETHGFLRENRERDRAIGRASAADDAKSVMSLLGGESKAIAQLEAAAKLDPHAAATLKDIRREQNKLIDVSKAQMVKEMLQGRKESELSPEDRAKLSKIRGSSNDAAAFKAIHKDVALMLPDEFKAKYNMTREEASKLDERSAALASKNVGGQLSSRAAGVILGAPVDAARDGKGGGLAGPIDVTVTGTISVDGAVKAKGKAESKSASDGKGAVPTPSAK